jgi:hypothetical protein
MSLYSSMTLSTCFFYVERLVRCHGCGGNLSLTLRENHEEDKLPGRRNDLPALLGRDKGNSTKWDSLGDPVQFLVQNNNNTVRPKLLYNMTFPQIRLVQKNIKNFKGRNITPPYL